MFKDFLIGNLAVIPTLALTMSCNHDGRFDTSQDISIER